MAIEEEKLFKPKTLNTRLLALKTRHLEHAAGKSTRRSRLLRQCLEMSFLALCSQSLSAADWTTSTAANHFGASGAGSPNSVNLPAPSKPECHLHQVVSHNSVPFHLDTIHLHAIGGHCPRYWLRSSP